MLIFILKKPFQIKNVGNLYILGSIIAYLSNLFAETIA